MAHVNLILLAGLLTLSPPADSSGPGPRIEDLRWLAGCWRMEEGGKETEEHWMRSDGETMLGMSRTSAGGETMSFEFMRIRQLESGDIAFFAQPSGAKATPFALKSCTKHEVVFENRSHDFPQRVIYRLRKDGSLLGRIEGIINGKPQAADFPMKRVRCP
jgi:hypothetical protein